ncbi:MAG TPA: hypothetical protein VFQ74_08550 [Pseudolysinimonas sp.]|nr:hypothetical protein [Pseudolysinimonas sp.]
MDVTGAGTAVMIAIAAALWFAYLLPTWMRRREYLETERTATRLQQTLRVMAETAELPDQVRVEVSSREAARAQRLLLAEQRRADAAAARAVAGARATPPAVGSSLRVRRRRAHRTASLLLVVATLMIVVQLWLVSAGTAGSGAWAVLAGGALLGIAGVSIRRRIDARGARQATPAQPRAASAAVERTASAPVPRAWTPVPVPTPLYLSHPEPQPVHPATNLVAELRAAALASEQGVRDAHEAPEVVPIRRQRPAAPDPTAAPVESPAMRRAAPSRWAAMGRLDGTDAAAPDLDEVLRRRRSAG